MPLDFLIWLCNACIIIIGVPYKPVIKCAILDLSTVHSPDLCKLNISIFDMTRQQRHCAEALAQPTQYEFGSLSLFCKTNFKAVHDKQFNTTSRCEGHGAV